MARLMTVKSARKPNKCGRCQRTIEVGESYYHWSQRVGSRFAKYVRCSDHQPRPSEYASNQYQQMILGALEGFDDGRPYLTGADLSAALMEVAETAKEIAEQLTQNADSMEDGFGHETEQTYEMRTRGEAWEDWADEIETQASNAESEFPDEALCEECQEPAEAHEGVPLNHEFTTSEWEAEDYLDVLSEQPE